MSTARLLEFFTRHSTLSLAFVVILGAIVWTFVQDMARGVRRVGPADLTRLINQDDAVVLDVRTESEFNQGHILNSVSMPKKYVTEQPDRLQKYRDRPLVAVCQTGQESARIGAQLTKQGFRKVYCLAGGIAAWEGASLPLTKR